MRSSVLASLLVAGALFTSESAFAADPSCDSIMQLAADGTGTNYTTTPAPNVIYITGSSAMKPIIAALAPVIFAAQSPNRPATLVYLSQGSCAGVASVAAGTPLPLMSGTPAAPTKASYWDPNSTTIVSSTKTLKEQNCTIPPATSGGSVGVNADIGASDVFAETCGYSLQSLPVADFQGPIQSMTFAVSTRSSESVISAEAAYLAIGLHAMSPWLDGNLIFRRNSGSGTQSMIAAAIGVGAQSWTGIDEKSSDGVYAALTTNLPADQASINKALGILAADYSSKPDVKQLAYQHTGQTCGYKPDANGSDKKNTREGRYAIWGPIHLITQVDSSGLAKKQEARDFISYLLGTVPAPLGVDLIQLESTLHVVPPCAMKVQRKSEMGAITPFSPQRGCGCAYDHAGTGVTTCTPCTTSAQCTGTNQSCNFGYCE
jgi:ABC-type phosphate transport system substrate-binding protein